MGLVAHVSSPAPRHLEGQGKNDYHEFQASLDCTNNETLSQKLAHVGKKEQLQVRDTLQLSKLHLPVKWYSYSYAGHL